MDGARREPDRRVAELAAAFGGGPPSSAFRWRGRGQYFGGGPPSSAAQGHLHGVEDFNVLKVRGTMLRMPVGDDTNAYRRKLPHLEKIGKTYFVTFTTKHRAMLPDIARDVILATCLAAHAKLHWVHCVVVMPDHVHIVTTPYETYRLATIIASIKDASAHRVNRLLRRRGTLWQRESFDRIIRAGENLMKKCTYLCENPVRAGLAHSPDQYPWTWRSWIDGPPRTAALH